MSSLSLSPNSPIRLLKSPTYDRAMYPRLALGRHHASWFLVYATRPIIESQRAMLCLNFLVPDDPNSVRMLSPSGNPVFTVGGYGDAARRVMDVLRSLRDKDGRSPVALTECYPAENQYGLLADVEVLVPENELIQACAHCGTWESQYGPRFLRCGGCKSRCYCSPECQQDDWKPQYHKGECRLLQDGKAFEVESRRKLHNNGWYFDYSPDGDKVLLEDSGPHTYERAVHESDVSYLGYGRRYPPHDVVPPTAPRPPLRPRNDGYPPGFVSTGDARADNMLYKMHYLRTHGQPDAFASLPKKYPVSDAVPADEIPIFPSLPEVPGFLPTGDPFLDESLLCAYLSTNGMEAEHIKLGEAVRARRASIETRRKLEAERRERTQGVIRGEREKLLAERGVSSISELAAITCPDGLGGQSLPELLEGLREEEKEERKE